MGVLSLVEEEGEEVEAKEEGEKKRDGYRRAQRQVMRERERK